MPDEVVERGRWRGAVGIDVADEVRLRRELEPLDQRAALADRLGDVDAANLWEFFRGRLDHAKRVVGAAIEHDDESEAIGVMFAKIDRVILQHGSDAALLIVGGDEQQNAGRRVGHAGGLLSQTRLGNAHQRQKAPSWPHIWEPRYGFIWSMSFQRTEPSSQPTLPPSAPTSFDEAPSALGLE